MKQKLVLHVVLISLLVGLFAYLHKSTDIQYGDPDRYYHLALSREMLSSGKSFFRTLPAIQGLGWDKYFSDKEFLFHQLTRFGYSLGGSPGAINIVLVFSCLIYISIYVLAAQFLSPLLSFGVVLATFCSPILFFRLMLLRPHVLSVFAFVLFFSSLLLRRPWFAFFSTLLFALSYHAFYVPLLCLGFAAIAFWFIEEQNTRRENMRLVSWGVFGLICGLLLNPYFPSNIIFAIEIAKIPSLLVGQLQGANFGEELYPLISNVFWDRFLYPILFFLTGLALWIYRWPTRTDSRSYANFFLMLLVNGFFLFLGFKSPRVQEYLIPTSGILLIFILYYAQPWTTLIRVIALVLGFHLLSAFYTAYHYIPKFNDSEKIQSNLTAIDAIPKSAANAKVFNCEWDVGPYIYFGRSDLQFIDILDPSLLYFRNPQAYNAREELKKGIVSDAYGLIKNAFKADYVVCYTPSVVAQLQMDPGFIQLHPTLSTTPIYERSLHVFAVKETAPAGYLSQGKISFWKDITTKNFEHATPATATVQKERDFNMANNRFINFAFLNKSESIYSKAVNEKKDGAFCAAFTPSAQDLAKYVGADYLSLGGGRNLRVWRNNKLLYKSGIGFPLARISQVVIPLTEKLRAADHFTFVACSSKAANYWGLSAAFWHKTQLAQLCEQKKNDRPMNEKTVDTEGALTSLPLETCIGPLAVHKPTI